MVIARLTERFLKFGYEFEGNSQRVFVCDDDADPIQVADNVVHEVYQLGFARPMTSENMLQTISKYGSNAINAIQKVQLHVDLIKFSADSSNITRWKRRYFVLSKPAQSLPGAFILNYYSDESCKKVKGCIDLDQCLEIIESLDSDQFPYLLAIKTTHKGKERTYFLATDTEEQMTTWVRNLCTVCGMKPEEPQPEPEPPRRQVNEEPVTTNPRPHTTKTSPKPSVHNHARSSPSVRHNEPSTSPPRRPPAVTSQPKPSNLREPSEYIPLETCSSGMSVKRTQRQMSIDSVPDELAPPPPGKAGGFDSDDVFQQPTYDIPPSASEDDIYKVPPPRPTHNGGLAISEDTYDHPPERNSPSTPRSSSSESQKGDSHLSQGFVYDFPPTRELSKDDVYDIPPTSHSDSLIDKISLNDVPPVRPPKPSYLISQSAQEPYMNLPSNSKVFTDLNKGIPIDTTMAPPPVSCAGMVHMSETYDIPKSDSARSIPGAEGKETLLNSTPPPPAHCGVEHKYINAAGGFVENQDVYLPMDPVINAVGSLTPEPRKSSTDNEVEYTDMSGKSSFEDSRPVYDHPPVRPAPRIDVPPQRPRKPGPNAEGGDTYSIFSTARTRSFKKSSSSSGSPMVKKRVPPPIMQTSVPLPTSRRGEMRHPDFSTSDEDDDEVLGSPLWETTPPAPGGTKDSELKYIDLDHDESSEQPVRSPVGQSSSQAPTEYHEIDFVKTDALKTVRETTNKERQKKVDS